MNIDAGGHSILLDSNKTISIANMCPVDRSVSIGLPPVVAMACGATTVEPTDGASNKFVKYITT